MVACDDKVTLPSPTSLLSSRKLFGTRKERADPLLKKVPLRSFLTG